MNYLDKLKHLQQDTRPDNTNGLPESVSVSGMSGPMPESQGDNAPPQGTPVTPNAVDPVIIEPAATHARPVFFERNDGRIYGPARVTDLAKTGTGGTEQFWVVIEFHGQPVWVRSDRLRSRQQFEAQQPMRVVPLIKESR